VVWKFQMRHHPSHQLLCQDQLHLHTNRIVPQKDNQRNSSQKNLRTSKPLKVNNWIMKHQNQHTISNPLLKHNKTSLTHKKTNLVLTWPHRLTIGTRRRTSHLQLHPRSKRLKRRKHPQTNAITSYPSQMTILMTGMPKRSNLITRTRRNQWKKQIKLRTRLMSYSVMWRVLTSKNKHKLSKKVKCAIL